MPQLPELKEQPLRIITASIGGGATFSEPQILTPFAREHLPDFFRDQINAGRTVIAIVGGGPEARVRMAAARAKHQNISSAQLDEIGIQVTRKNAACIADWLKNDMDIRVQMFTFKQSIQSGIIYLGYGTEPGHNTDYVAVQAAIEAGQKILLNISNQPGLFRVSDGTTTDEVIPDITWREYLRIAPTHYAGIQHPFPKEAAQLAMENEMTVILLGSVMDNIRRCISGEEFIGTVIHP